MHNSLVSSPPFFSLPLFMKIAHVFIRMPVGGAEDLVGDILRTAPAGIDICVVCLQELGKIGTSLQEQFPGKVELLPWVPGKRFKPGAVLMLARWLRQQGIQLVHTHVYNAHIYGVLSAWCAGISAVLHHHKTYAAMRWHRKIILQTLSRRVSAHITLSEQTKRDLCRVFSIAEERVHVFVNPVDAETFHPASDLQRSRQALGLDPDMALVGTVASLTEPKNHLLNVEMTARLQQQGFKGRFLLFGEGGDRERISKAAQEQRLTGFELMGARRPIAPWMQALDVFTLSSTWEGQPMALLQALACELPIVASNIEGNAAVLGADHPALFDVQDAGAYANTVWRVLNDPAYRTAILEHQKRRKAELPVLCDYSRDLAAFYRSVLQPASD